MFIDGDLRGQIGFYKKQGTPVPESCILWYMYQIMLGLESLHEQHILHCDLKPENVFINEKGDLKLGDLGICRVLVTAAGQIGFIQMGGTIYYMAPECFQNKPGTACDIWSVGCIFHQVMKGEVLFRSEIQEENHNADI